MARDTGASDAPAARRSCQPDRSLVTEQVDEVEIPGADGYFGVLPGHTPLLAMLQVGELWYRQGRRSTTCRSRSGSPKCCPIASRSWRELAERADEIDVARAEAAKKRAEERLAKPTADIDFERARIALLKVARSGSRCRREPRSV